MIYSSHLYFGNQLTSLRNCCDRTLLSIIVIILWVSYSCYYFFPVSWHAGLELLLCLISEFEDAFQGIQDWPRIHGSVPFQSYRRTDYSSSPPTKGDSSSYSQGIYGKWDSRSSGRSERDTDPQSDWDSGLLAMYSSLLLII